MFLGIDLGTSSVKVVLTGLSGKVWGEADSPYPVYGMENGFFEQDPDDWTGSILSAVQILRAKLPEEIWQGVEAIGLSAQMPTMVLLGKDGELLDHAIVWCDSRAEEEGDKLLRLWGKDRHYCKTGVKLDGRYIIPMYQWVREYKPELLEHPHRILSAKDYIYYWMCGKAFTDPSTASGFAVYNINTEDWDSELCAEAGVDIKCLPEIMAPEENPLPLKEKLRKAFGLSGEIPVSVGAADSVAGVFGLGAVEPGTVCQICGSSTAIIAVSSKIAIDPEDRFFVTPLVKKGTFGFEADILSTGSTSRWLSMLVGKTPGELSSIAKKAPPGSEGVIFAPYMSGGEQSVLWDPNLSGGILGLSFSHNISHIVRAHYEGICFEAKRCLEAFCRNGYEVKKVLMSGPVSGDPFFMQLMADILDLECTAAETDNASAYGAALLAGVGTGRISWDSITHERTGRTAYEPQRSVSELYSEYYKRYLAASAASKV